MSGLHNIYNPKTNMWRCYASGEWITEWMTEKDYKAWIYEEYIKVFKDDLKPSRYITLEEINYKERLNEWCNDRCNCSCGQSTDDACNSCYYNKNFIYYKEHYEESGEDPLNFFKET